MYTYVPACKLILLNTSLLHTYTTTKAKNHVPDMIKRYGNIWQFSRQGILKYCVTDYSTDVCISVLLPGVENNNDVAKRNYFSRNLDDPAGEVLKTKVRLEATQSHNRPKRKYVKQNKQYWEDGGIQESRKCRRILKSRTKWHIDCYFTCV